MKALNLRGVVRGGGFVVTTRPDTTVVVPDLVDRQFTAMRPNQLWVSDFTYVSTGDGFVYTAFVIDVFARRIVGWKVAHAMRTDFVLDALEQALHQRGDEAVTGLVHHSDRGVQYVSMRYTERLAHAGIAPSVGSRGDSYDDALAESVIGLYKTEVIGRRDRWRNLEAVELPPCGGSTGLTIAACSARSASCRQRNSRRATISRLLSPESLNPPSHDSGPIQSARSRPDNTLASRSDDRSEYGQSTSW